MEYLLYIIPFFVFISLFSYLYYISEPEKRNYLKIFFPSLVVTLVVFFIMKFDVKFEDQPMMFGNYFD